MFAVTISKVRWLALLACLVVMASGKVIAQQACVFTESQFQGTRHCFQMDSLTDVPDGIAVKSVRVEPGAELIVATGTQLGGEFSRYAQNVSHPAFSGPAGLRYRSFQVRPAACLYQDAHYKGRDICFAPGPLEPELSATLDKNTSSVTMARGLALYAFSGQNGKGNSSFYYGDYPFLRNFNDKARSLQLVRWIVNCFEDCVIPFSDAYDLDKAVYTTSLQVNKGKWFRLSQAVATFEIDSRQAFTVNVGNTVDLRFTGRSVTVTYRNDTANAYDFQLADGTAYVSIALGFGRGKQDLDYQLIAADASRRLLKASPIATVAQEPGRMSQTFAIENTSSHLVRLKALSFAQVTPRAWRQPATACWDDPMLAVATYFLGPCSAGSTGLMAQDAEGVVFSAGAQPWRYHMAVNPVDVARRSPRPATTLASFARGHNPLARYAASYVCRSTAAAATAHRVRRNPDHAATCIERTMTIITLYQALFGPRWDANNFQNVIDSILAYGTTGYASAQPELENELIEAVRRQADVGTADTRRQTAVAAFYAADRLYHTSRNGTLDLEQAAWHANQAGALQWNRSSAAPATMAEASEAALGTYELDLTRYQPLPILPRIASNGRWEPDVQHPFEIQFVTPDDRAELAHLQSVMRSWTQLYLAATRDTALSPDQQDLADAGASLAASLDGAITCGEISIYVVASYQGQPVAVLMASINDNDHTTASIDNVVSLPRNVIYRGRSDVVRGAGSAALHAALTYLRGRGINQVYSYAVTTPSAIVKQRAGFEFMPSDESDSESGESRRR